MRGDADQPFSQQQDCRLKARCPALSPASYGSDTHRSTQLGRRDEAGSSRARPRARRVPWPICVMQVFRPSTNVHLARAAPTLVGAAQSVRSAAIYATYFERWQVSSRYLKWCDRDVQAVQTTFLVNTVPCAVSTFIAMRSGRTVRNRLLKYITNWKKTLLLSPISLTAN